MTTTETTTTPDEIGRKLADLVVEVNDGSFPGNFSTYLDAFAKAAPLIRQWDEQFDLFGPNLSSEVIWAFDKRCDELIEELHAGV